MSIDINPDEIDLLVNVNLTFDELLYLHLTVSESYKRMKKWDLDEMIEGLPLQGVTSLIQTAETMDDKLKTLVNMMKTGKGATKLVVS